MNHDCERMAIGEYFLGSDCLVIMGRVACSDFKILHCGIRHDLFDYQQIDYDDVFETLKY